MSSTNRDSHDPDSLDPDWSEYQRLRDLVLEGIATPSQSARFQLLVIQSATMRRDYAEFAFERSALLFAGTQLDRPQVSLSDLPSSAAMRSDWRIWAREHRGLVAVLTLVCSLLIALSTILLVQRGRTSHGVATLVSTEGCQWGESSLPTTAGHALTTGRMRLVKGIAVFRFDCVNLTLEGPADLEIVGEKECFLYAGRAFSSVEPGGEGFTVRTPTAILTDQGTIFGVNVHPTGESDLQVFSGLVDAVHRSTGEALSVTTNRRVRLTHQAIGSVGAMNQLENETLKQDEPAKPLIVNEPFRSIQLTTAVGSGDDAYVSRGELPAESGSPTALLVKRTPLNDTILHRWARKAFLRFDLSLLSGARIESAKLQLHGVATNLGYAALMPDATFYVYGVTDETQDLWSQASLDWTHCPASNGEQSHPNEQHVVLLGQFIVPQANPVALFEIDTEYLTEFLRSDTNGVATLIIVSDTTGYGESYVHGFASKRHPELPPPTLRLKVAASASEG